MAHQTFVDIHVVVSSKHDHEGTAKEIAHELLSIARQYKSETMHVAPTATVWQQPDRHVIVKLREGDDVA